MNSDYIGNKYSMIAHRSNCGSIGMSNIEYIKTVESATRKGYRPCGNCKPFILNSVDRKLKKLPVDKRVKDYILQRHPFFGGNMNFADMGEYNRALEESNKHISLRDADIKELHAYYEGDVDISIILSKVSIIQNFAFIYLDRGVIYSKIGQYNKTLADFEEAISINYNLISYRSYWEKFDYLISDYIKIFHCLAAEYTKTIYELTLEYTKIIKTNPNNAFVYACRGFCYRYRGGSEVDNAISDFTKAINLNPNLAFVYYMRGNCYTEKKYYAKAIEDFNCAIAIDPTHPIYFTTRGGIYETLCAKKTIEDYQKALKLDPYFQCTSYWDYRARLNGLLYIITYNENKVLEYSKAINLNGDDESLYLKRGRSYLALGSFVDKSLYSNAIHDLNKTIKLNPDSMEAYRCRGLINIELEQYDDAIKDFNKVLLFEPDKPHDFNKQNALNSIAEAYLKKGDYMKANEYFDKSHGGSSLETLYYCITARNNWELLRV